MISTPQSQSSELIETVKAISVSMEEIAASNQVDQWLFFLLGAAVTFIVCLFTVAATLRSTKSSTLAAISHERELVNFQRQTEMLAKIMECMQKLFEDFRLYNDNLRQTTVDHANEVYFEEYIPATVKSISLHMLAHAFSPSPKLEEALEVSALWVSCLSPKIPSQSDDEFEKHVKQMQSIFRFIIRVLPMSLKPELYEKFSGDIDIDQQLKLAKDYLEKEEKRHLELRQQFSS